MILHGKLPIIPSAVFGIVLGPAGLGNAWRAGAGASMRRTQRAYII
jgi:hypothetical protein